MATHSEVIQANKSFLCKNTKITPLLLDMCTEIGILTTDESVEIEQHSKQYDRNREFYTTIGRKDREAFKKLIVIMESEDTLQSNDVLLILKSCQMFLTSIEPTPKRPRISQTTDSRRLLRSCGHEGDETSPTRQEVLKCKWWPAKQIFILVNSFHERKSKDKLYVKQLHNFLNQNQNRMAVISQKVAVSGLGGVGKTTTAKWYANHYKDFYDHIIWLDCGEGSLLKSFRDLARDLDIKNRYELDLTALARESFLALDKFKSLWIFDNAECYTGKEGIRDVLPRNENFHSIITSRNREWGNKTGHGTISQFQLDVFDIEESISFMKHNLEDKSFHRDDLERLCELLGNLPLALQIAASTLNRQKIKLSDYIERVENSDHIINRNFDDYERTINATLRMSLEFIKYNENDQKQLAYQILLTFAYIPPDNIEISFFQKVLESTPWEIREAMDLLEMYSLILKRIHTVDEKFSDDQVDMFDYSIHRLLQQVTRHNARDTESDTIRRILNCEGFLEYKLVPFTLADEELKNELPKIRVQLIDQIELSQLIKKRKFTDALHLSEIIRNTMKCFASDFNYAICLKNQRKFKAALEIFDRIYNELPKPEIVQNLEGQQDSLLHTELVDLSTELSANLVGSQLFIIHLLESRFKMADEILRRERRISVRKSEDLLRCILEALRTNNIIPVPTMFKLSVVRNSIHLNLKNIMKREIQFSFCEVDETSVLPEHIERLQLRLVSLKGDNVIRMSNNVDLSDFIPSSVIDLDISFTKYFAENRSGSKNPKCIALNAVVSLEKLSSVDKIWIGNCKIKLSDKPSKIFPSELQFRNVSFLRSEMKQNEEAGAIFLNELINFQRVKKFALIANDLSETISSYKVDEAAEVMSLIRKSDAKICVSRVVFEMTGSYNVNTVILKGDRITIRNWERADWNINRLFLSKVPFQKSQLKLRQLEIERSSIKLSSLPVTVETLILGEETQVINENGDFLLPRLKYLHVISLNDSVVDIPFLLRICENLIGLKLEANPCYKIGINTVCMCMSIKTLKMKGIEVVGERVQTIDRLILDINDLTGIDQILKRFQPDQLVINTDSIRGCNEKSLLPLIQKPIKSIIVGNIRWKSFETSPLRNYVDGEGRYYLFENQRGRKITEFEFRDIKSLPGEYNFNLA